MVTIDQVTPESRRKNKEQGNTAAVESLCRAAITNKHVLIHSRML